MATEALRQNEMMNHLLTSLEQGEDIGHYGRLVFAMVARHFLDEDELVDLLTRNPAFDEHQAKALCHQVRTRGYNPPSQQRIMEWQREQSFPICPHADAPGACNLYRDLKFPDGVYDRIEQFHEQAAEAESR